MVLYKHGLVKQLSFTLVIFTLSVGATGANTKLARSPRLTPVAMSEEQRAALADGRVSSAEDHASSERFALCMQIAGFPVIRLPAKYHLVQYGTPAAESSSGTDRACYEQEFRKVDGIWQVAHQDYSSTSEWEQVLERKWDVCAKVFDLGRVSRFFGVAVPIIRESPYSFVREGLQPTDLVTNEFIDKKRKL